MEITKYSQYAAVQAFSRVVHALVLTCDLEFQSYSSCGHDPNMCKNQSEVS